MSDRLSNEELARRLERVQPGQLLTLEHLVPVIERLSETCATCRHFVAPRPNTGACRVPPNNGVVFRTVPADGSGYCWQWERRG